LKLRIAFDVLIMLALLAFGPRENRLFLFRDAPDLLYGEVVVYKGNGSAVSFATNASSAAATIKEPKPIRVLSRDMSSGTYLATTTGNEVYANTIAIIERPAGSGVPDARVAFGAVQPAPPQALRIVTEAESFHTFLWVFSIAVLTAMLAYAICELSWRCGSPVQDVLGEGAEPS
jgi:hypothetical protein